MNRRLEEFGDRKILYFHDQTDEKLKAQIQSALEQERSSLLYHVGDVEKFHYQVRVTLTNVSASIQLVACGREERILSTHFLYPPKWFKAFRPSYGEKIFKGLRQLESEMESLVKRAFLPAVLW